MSPRRRGLRWRIAALFVGGAFLLSTGLAVASYQITRLNVLQERERSAVRAAYFDAAAVRAAAVAGEPDLVEALRTLDTGQARRPLIRRDGAFFARSADDGLTSAVPLALLRLVESGKPAVQRVRVGEDPLLVVGVPLDDSGTALFEVQSLAEPHAALRNLALTLAGVAAAVTLAAAGLSVWVARRALSPLQEVADRARQVSRGDLSARMPRSDDPDLAVLTAAFNDMVAEVSRRIEREQRFAADVSHELRSPLQTLVSASQVLSNRLGSLDEAGRTAATLVVQESERFSELVQTLMDLARSDLPPEVRQVDVAGLLRDLARRRDVPEAALEAPAELSWSVDPVRLRQVLDNLLANAERHGGGVHRAAVAVVDDRLRFEVDDTGPGIPPSDRELVFDRFARGRASHVREGAGGAGLGLSLVAEHVAAHQGSVAVLDRPGGGCRMRVEIPGGTS